MVKPCIICYRLLGDDVHSKTGSNDPDEEVKGGERLKRFFQLLERYLNDVVAKSNNEGMEGAKRFPLREVINLSGRYCGCCGNCSYLVESFCELYHQMKSIELLLNWKLAVLKRIMFSAQRVPSRISDIREIVMKQLQIKGGCADGDIDMILDFKRDIIEKCKRKLQAAFPRVALKKHQLPGRENVLQRLKNEPRESTETECGDDGDLTLTPTCIHKGDVERKGKGNAKPFNWIKIEVDQQDNPEDGIQPDLNFSAFGESHAENIESMDSIPDPDPETKKSYELRRSRRLREVHRCSKCMKTFSNMHSLLQHEVSHGDEEDNNDNLIDNEVLSNWSDNESEEESSLGEPSSHGTAGDDDLRGLHNVSFTTPSTQTVVNNQEAFSYSQFSHVNSWEEDEGPDSNAAVPYVENIIMDDPAIAVKYEPDQGMDTIPPESTRKANWSIETGNSNPNKWKCNVCSKEYAVAASLNQHYNLMHLGMKLECNLCGEAFKSESNYELHNGWSHNKGRYNCDIRHFEFVTRNPSKTSGPVQQIQFHDRRKQSFFPSAPLLPTPNKCSKMFKCKYCDEHCQTMNEMRTHVTLLHFSKSVCQVLVTGKLAVQYSPIAMVPPNPALPAGNLLSGDRPDRPRTNCAQCSLNFASAWSYQYHYRSVHEGFSYRCHECTEVFTQKESLLQHQMTANCKSGLNSTINTILIAEDKYFQKSQLNVPKFPVLDHLCDLCGIDFGCKKSFMEHRSSSHPESSQDLLEIFPPTSPSPVEQLNFIENNDEIIELINTPDPGSPEVISQISHIQSRAADCTDSKKSNSADSESLCSDNLDLESEKMSVDDVPMATKKCNRLDGIAPGLHTVSTVMSDNGPAFICKHCGAKCPTKNQMRMHVSLLHLYKATGKILIQGKVAVQHSPAIVVPPKPIKEAAMILPKSSKNRKCLHCSERYASYWAYQYHYRSVHMGMTFRCRECDKVFAKKGNLLQHQMICCTPKENPNPSSEIVEKENSPLNMIHPRPQTHLCELCGIGFGAKTALIEHHRSAHPDYEKLLNQIKVAFNISLPKIKYKKP